MLPTKKCISIKFLIVLSIVIVILIFNIHFLTLIAQPLNINHTTDIKFVLYWSPFWHQADYYYGYGFNPFKYCAHKNCYATNNRTLIPLEKFDTLFFHASTYNKAKHGVPWIRSPHQRYVFMNVEAPIYICPELKQYSSYFNWTMSYRFDSDIVRRHGYVMETKTNYAPPSSDVLRNKTKLAAWFVSNCRTTSRREDLVRNVQKFIPVDVYGDCGKLKCDKKKNNQKLSATECYDMVAKQYKFYFAFENSYCRDYSTEKLYNILTRDVVPVVYGGGDYALSAPPNSVINVEEFESPEALANYLKYLDEHDEEYLKYFEWKKNFNVTTFQFTSACQLCDKLNEPLKQSIYYDLDKWWWGENKSVCKKNKQLPKIVSKFL